MFIGTAWNRHLQGDGDGYLPNLMFLRVSTVLGMESHNSWWSKAFICSATCPGKKETKNNETFTCPLVSQANDFPGIVDLRIISQILRGNLLCHISIWNTHTPPCSHSCLLYIPNLPSVNKNSVWTSSHYGCIEKTLHDFSTQDGGPSSILKEKVHSPGWLITLTMQKKKPTPLHTKINKDR